MNQFRQYRTLLVALALVISPLSWAQDEESVSSTLDAFHQAAADADMETYLGLMTEDVVFLGTDGTERWQGEEFREFVRGHFSKGRGWLYTMTERHIKLGEGGDWAQFDELLENEKLGQCRGSGILVRGKSGWQLSQYNLSVPVPNEMVVDMAEAIRGLASDEAQPVSLEIDPTEEELVSEPAEPEKRCGKRHKTNRKADC